RQSLTAKRRQEEALEAFRLAGTRVMVALTYAADMDGSKHTQAEAKLAKGLRIPYRDPLWPRQGAVPVDVVNALHHLRVQAARPTWFLEQSRGEQVAAAYPLATRLGILQQATAFVLDAAAQRDLARPLEAAAKKVGLPAGPLTGLLDRVRRG